ncbi:hypothetical protein AB0H43_13115 [Hamadaea sp. NPDC050747]|uniref:hypothetical protein n=1 Tax=Hamadaea sp. NPDC050747 TaxID=3155789 RepID=UPI0033D5ACF2
MSRTLADRYRRLAFYPQAHRDMYAQEMLGVLLDDARPGQRYPRLADVVVLIWCGLRARATALAHPLRGDSWRSSTGTLGVLLMMLLALRSLRPVILPLAVWTQFGDPPPTFDTTVVVLAVGWSAAAVAAMTALRRTAAYLAATVVFVHSVLLTRKLPSPRKLRCWWSRNGLH